jgi:hypothetical protein
MDCSNESDVALFAFMIDADPFYQSPRIELTMLILSYYRDMSIMEEYIPHQSQD